MTKGDIKTIIPTSVADTAYLTIQAGAGEEWLIGTIEYGNAVQISVYDGSNDTIFYTDTTAGICIFPLGRGITNTIYLRVRNVSGGASQYITYSGIQTK